MTRRNLLAFVGTAGVLLLAYVAFWVLNQSFARGPVFVPAADAMLEPSTVDVPVATGPAKYVGVVSCTAQACHGAAAPPGTKGAEYTTWSQEDLHARAYDVLKNERSVQMVVSLGLSTPAHQTKQCLACHVTPAADREQGPRFAAQEGVGCEACHGPAQHWLAPHVTSRWRDKSASEKSLLGMHDTKNLPQRLRRCAGCHVGSPGREVNHDVIAAGHPRLVFEAGAFHANWPKHWDRSKELLQDPVREARLWAVGQAVSAEAALRTLSERAGDPQRPWPELAEYDCYACHHQLDESSRRRQPGVTGQRLGSPVWGSWHLAVWKELSASGPAPCPTETFDSLTRLGELASQFPPDRPAVERESRAAAEGLAVWGVSLDEAGYPTSILKRMAEALVAPSSSAAVRHWDDATQRLLAGSALHAAIVDMDRSLRNQTQHAARLRLIQDAERPLQFPLGLASPRGFDAENVQDKLERLAELLQSPPPAGLEIDGAATVNE